jgi:hypothetical protein
MKDRRWHDLHSHGVEGEVRRRRFDDREAREAIVIWVGGDSNGGQFPMISLQFRVGPSTLTLATPPEEPHAPYSCHPGIGVVERAENKRVKEMQCEQNSTLTTSF